MVKMSADTYHFSHSSGLNGNIQQVLGSLKDASDHLKASDVYRKVSVVYHYVVKVDKKIPSSPYLRGIASGTNGILIFSSSLGSALRIVGNFTDRIPFSLFGLMSVLVAPLALFSIARSGYHLIIRGPIADKFEALLELGTNSGVALRIGATLAMSIEKLFYAAPLAVSIAPFLTLAGGILSSLTTLICAFGWVRSHHVLKSLMEMIENKENEQFSQHFVDMNSWKVSSCFAIGNPQRFKKIIQNVNADLQKTQDHTRTELLMNCLKKRLIVKKRMDLLGVCGGVVHIVAVIIFFVTVETPACPIAYVAIGISLSLTAVQCGLNFYLTQIFWSEINKIDPLYVPKENFFTRTFYWIQSQGGRIYSAVV